MICNNCGRELKDDAKFCDGCGLSIENNSIPQIESVNETNGEKEVTSEVNVEQANIQEENVTNQETVIENEKVDNTDNKKNNGKIIIIIVVAVVLLIGIIIAIVLLSSREDKNKGDNSGNGNGGNIVSGDNGNSDNPSSNNNNPVVNPGETKEEKGKRLISNISYDMNCNLVQHNCLMTVTNNNKENVNAVLTNLEILDKNNEMIGFDNSPLYNNGLGPGEKSYSTIYNHMFKEGKIKDYDHFKADHYLQDFNFKNHKNDLTYTVTKDDKNHRYVFKVKNNSDSNIDSVRFGMLFYKNNKLVAATTYSDIRDSNDKYISYVKPQEEFFVEVNYPFLEGFSGEIVDYDKYEIYIQEAYEYIDAKDIRYRESHKRED